MFDIAPSELMLVALVALVVIGPKDLPRVMRTVGKWVAQARGMARHFRSGLDEMIRQSEIEEMEKKWAEENARIMSEHPMLPSASSSEIIEAEPAARPLVRGDEARPPAAPEPEEAELPFDKPA